MILSKLYTDLRSELGAHEMHMDRLTNLVTLKLEQNSQLADAIKAKLESQSWAIRELNQRSILLEGVALGVSSL